MLSRLDFRPELVGLEPYQTFPTTAKQIRLNTNENPYSVKLSIQLDDNFSNLNRYPDDNCSDLKELMLKSLFGGFDNLTEHERWIYDDYNNRMTIANGSNEIMSQIFNAFGGPTPGEVYPDGARSAITFTPSYSMYPQYARDSYTKFISVSRCESDFELTAQMAIDAIKEHKPSIVLITNPNNPTGNWTDIDIIREILDYTNSLDLVPIVVIDEAYVDFREHNSDGSTKLRSAIELLPEYENLLIVRTLSKALALAGVRIGYAYGHKSVIDQLKIVHLPYNLSTLTQSLAKTLICDIDRMQEVSGTVKTIRDERDIMFKELTELAKNYLVKPYPSQANFILIEFGVDNMVTLLDDFMKINNMIIRIVGGKNRFRVTIGTPDENKQFMALFKQFLAHNSDNLTVGD